MGINESAKVWNWWKWGKNVFFWKRQGTEHRLFELEIGKSDQVEGGLSKLNGHILRKSDWNHGRNGGMWIRG